MLDELPIIGAGSGAIILAILAYLFGGQIRKTDADKLWAESRDIRKELRNQVERLEERLDECEKRAAARSLALEEENAELRTERDRDKKQIAKLEFEVVRLQGRVTELEAKTK